jgi:hypothetical protein
VADGRVVATQDLEGLAEVSPDGNTTAFASFEGPNATWSYTSRAAPGATIILASATVNVTPAGGSWDNSDEVDDGGPQYGTVAVNVTFYLNNSSSPSANAVRFAVGATNWPWVDAEDDSLGLEFSMLAENSTSIAAGSATNVVDELLNTTHAQVASLAWAPSADVGYSNGSISSSEVGTFRAFAPDGVNSTVHLLFSQVAGGYQNLSYDPWVALNLSVFGGAPVPAWVITAATWGAVVGAVAVSTALAAIAAVRRRAGPETEL